MFLSINDISSTVPINISLLKAALTRIFMPNTQRQVKPVVKNVSDTLQPRRKRILVVNKFIMRK